MVDAPYGRADVANAIRVLIMSVLLESTPRSADWDFGDNIASLFSLPFIPGSLETYTFQRHLTTF